MKLLDLMESTDRTWRLLENLSNQLVLLEDRIDWMRKNLLPRLQHHLTITDAEAQEIFQKALGADPTKKKIYTQWTLQRLISGDAVEHLPRVAEDLKDFHEHAKTEDFPGQHRDIGSLRSFDHLHTVMQKFHDHQNTQQHAQHREILADTEVVERRGNYRLVKPLSERAAGWWGRDTDWCTAYGCEWGRHPQRTSAFDNYDRGSIYILLRGDTPVLQFHWDEDEGVDEIADPEDQVITPEEFADYAQHMPQTYSRIQENIREIIDVSLEEDEPPSIEWGWIKAAYSDSQGVQRDLQQTTAAELKENPHWLDFAIDLQKAFPDDYLNSAIIDSLLTHEDVGMIIRHQQLNHPTQWISRMPTRGILQFILDKRKGALRRFLSLLSDDEQQQFLK